MLRIGIVGCGRILNAHLQGFLALRAAGVDTFRITALTARNRDDALMFRLRGEGPPPRPPVMDPATGDPLAAPHTYVSDFQADVLPEVYTDYSEMITEGPVDAVLDLTTLALHHQVADVALGHGKHLLTQKPLAISVRAGRRMVDLAKAKGLTLGVFENVRTMAQVRAAAWAVAHGLVGTPQMAILGSLGGVWSPDRVVADTPWRHQKLLAGGGGSIDIGVHQFDWLRAVMGEVRAVSGVARTFEADRRRDGEKVVTADVDDTYLATAFFDNNAIGQLLWSWAGRGLAIEISDTPAFLGSEGGIHGRWLVRNSERGDLMAEFAEGMSDEERERFFPLGLQDAYAILQYDWLKAIERREDPETSGAEGLRDLACAFGVLESSTLGRVVTLDEVLSGAADAYQREIDEHYSLI
ncbi:MAG: Gfo/Idh/MocA family oxidoreductase [Anaerolineae bacterium]